MFAGTPGIVVQGSGFPASGSDAGNFTGGSASIGSPAVGGVAAIGGGASFGGGVGVFAAGGNGNGNPGGDDAFTGSGGCWSPAGLAGSFTGDINVTGKITAGTKDFLIDHPLDPANKYLYHSSVESSEMKNIYDGVVTLNAGSGGRISGLAWSTQQGLSLSEVSSMRLCMAGGDTVPVTLHRVRILSFSSAIGSYY